MRAKRKLGLDSPVFVKYIGEGMWGVYVYGMLESTRGSREDADKIAERIRIRESHYTNP